MSTLAGLLYPNAENAHTQLTERLRRHPLGASVSAWPGVLATVAKDILVFLDMPAGNLAVVAYQKHRLINEARRETADTPGSRQVVQLMKHRITNHQQSTIEVEVNGVRKTLATLVVMAELSVESVTAIVESGHLIDLAPGFATGTLVLSAAGAELARAETQPVDLSIPHKTRVVVELAALGEPVVDRVVVAR